MKIRTFKNGDTARSPHPGGRLVINDAKSEEVTLYIYDEISWWGINANDFAKTLASLGDSVKTIHLRINSPGGNVFEAHAMATLLRQHDAHVITHIDALAASAASYLALAGDEVRMSDNAFIMIHDPWTVAMGNADEFRKTAGTLDQIGDGIVNEYVKKSNADRKQIEQWMKDETWFNAEDAAEHGFVDYIDGEKTDAKNMFDLSVFAKVPDPLRASESTQDDQASREVPLVGNKRTAEKALRDEGYSWTDAKRIVKALSKPVLGHREDDENAEDVRDALTRAIAALSTPHPLHHGRITQAA